MPNTLRGLLSHKSAVETLTSKTTGNSVKKQTILLDCSPHDYFTGQQRYENIVPLDFIGKSCDLLAAYKVGDIVEVSFVVQGNAYTKPDGTVRRFVSLRPYAIKSVRGGVEANTAPAATATAAPVPAPTVPTAPAPAAVPPPSTPADDGKDDLPF